MTGKYAHRHSRAPRRNARRKRAVTVDYVRRGHFYNPPIFADSPELKRRVRPVLTVYDVIAERPHARPELAAARQYHRNVKARTVEVAELIQKQYAGAADIGVGNHMK